MKANLPSKNSGGIAPHANLAVLGAVVNMWRRTKGQSLIQINGDSMVPLIRNGDYVLVIHDPASLQTGHVAVFQRDGKLTAHRVIRVLANEVGPTFLTKGDNALQLDPPWTRDQLVGQVLAIDRGAGPLYLDSYLWRIFGRCIAVTTSLWVEGEGWGRELKRRFFGPQPNRLTTWLYRKARAVFNRCSRTLRAAFCHLVHDMSWPNLDDSSKHRCSWDNQKRFARMKKPRPNLLQLSEPTVADLRPEVQLLLCCARTHVGPEIAERMKALVQQNLDWTFLLRMASQQGMLPLVYWNLKSTCLEVVPKTILARLREHFYANAGNNFFLTGELLKILKLFESHSIPAIPYKGPALAVSVYENLALREFGDLDILVPQKEVLRATDLLISHGFEPGIPFTPVERADLQAKFGYFYEFELYAFRSRTNGRRNRVPLELHWRLPATFNFDSSLLWERLEPLSLAGTTVRHFRPEDLLLILCAHGFKHFWQSLKWICDVAELIRRHPDMDWTSLKEQAAKIGGKRVLLLGAFLANDLLETELPADVLAETNADPTMRSLAAQVRQRLFRAPLLPVGVVNNLRIRERWQERVHYLVGLLTHAVTPDEKDRAFLPLPMYLSFLHYLIRPFRMPLRLAKKYRLRPLALFKHLVG